MRHVASLPDGRETIGKSAKPLTEPVLFILISLAQKPQHGYALMKDISELSHGRVSLTTGTLYGALHRLLDDGWIERFEQEDTSRDRQAYRLAPTGRERLQLEMDRLRELTRIGAARLRTKET